MNWVPIWKLEMPGKAWGGLGDPGMAGFFSQGGADIIFGKGLPYFGTWLIWGFWLGAMEGGLGAALVMG